VERLYHSMVNDRLAELRQLPDPPFLFAFSGSGSFVRTKDVVSQNASVQEAGLSRGLETLLVELSRVKQHGFNASEVERAKKDMLRFYESAYTEREKEESDRFSNEISSVFLEQEPMPGIEFEYGLAQRFLPAISLDEVNHLAREWSSTQNRVILVNGP